ncbi:nitroreductase/quinone reductase family protein [Kribbella sp. NPDC051936]|uniref:nitroreductase/quinone reductase family protein n=1 Tax=Kribbella sp. NPDC051936 TaxID=3154946 RepID=UPI003421CC13
MNPLYAIKRWLYRGGRPGRLARGINWIQRLQHSSGLLVPHYAVTLEVTGRRSGRAVRLPVAVVEYDGGRYLVSMLGSRANWVLNVRNAQGKAVLHRRGAEAVRLIDVAVTARPPILRRYLAVAPGARPHFPVDRRSSEAAFTAVADRYPVFRVDAR